MGNRLPSVSWVITPPDWQSEHPDSSTCEGENATVTELNAIIEAAPAFDEHDGGVDCAAGRLWRNVRPCCAADVDTFGLGPRVPLLIISPYARPGHISTTQYEFSSVLKFIETRFNLPALSTRDAGANDITDSFNFNQQALPPLFILKTRTCPLASATQAEMGTGVKNVASTAIARHLELSNLRPTALTIDSIASTSPQFCPSTKAAPQS